MSLAFYLAWIAFLIGLIVVLASIFIPMEADYE